MGIKGTYVVIPNINDTTEDIFNNRNDEAYYIIDTISINSIYNENKELTENVNLLIISSVYQNKNERINRTYDNFNKLEEINFNFDIQKDIVTDKIWDYCYNISKTKLRELIEKRILNSTNENDVLDEIYKNGITFEDV
mgnify:CR=1 FL=1|tara:strand:+ start:2793 stop:3209 length:417 start_codon:yes stop_codon:yes gene_type:complete